MLGVHRSTEPLEAVIIAVGHLDVVKDRTTTKSAHGKRVEFRVRLCCDTGELDAHVPKDATRVFVICSAKPALAARCRVGNAAFESSLAGRMIRASLAADQNAAPVTASTLSGSCTACKDDRAFLRAVGYDRSTAVDHKR